MDMQTLRSRFGLSRRAVAAHALGALLLAAVAVPALAPIAGAQDGDDAELVPGQPAPQVDSDGDGISNRDEVQLYGLTRSTTTPTTTASATGTSSTTATATATRTWPTRTSTGSPTSRRWPASSATAPARSRRTPTSTASATATRSTSAATRSTPSANGRGGHRRGKRASAQPVGALFAPTRNRRECGSHQDALDDRPKCDESHGITGLRRHF